MCHRNSPPASDDPPQRWADLLGLPLTGQDGPPLSLVVLADPSFLRIQELLSGLDFTFPAAGKIGELEPDERVLVTADKFCNIDVYPAQLLLPWCRRFGQCGNGQP